MLAICHGMKSGYTQEEAEQVQGEGVMGSVGGGINSVARQIWHICKGNCYLNIAIIKLPSKTLPLSKYTLESDYWFVYLDE